MSSTYSSDTESESGIQNPYSLDACEFARLSTQCTPGDQKASSPFGHPNTVRDAVEVLLSLDISAAVNDTALHEVSSCSGVILGFLESILLCPEKQDFPNTVDLLYLRAFQQSWSLGVPVMFLRIVSVQEEFLSSLFDYKKVFYKLASQDCPREAAPSIVICWVDVILAKLGEAICILAAEAPIPDDYPAIPTSLKKQQEDDSLRAAAQLPENWSDVLQFMASDHASSASVRLSIHLTFGAKIIGSRLGCPSRSSTPLTASTSSCVLPALGAYTNRLASAVDDCNNSLSESGFPGRHRVTAAMAIAVFATMHIRQELLRDIGTASPFLPHTLRNILRIVELIIYGDRTLQVDIMVPPDKLDAAQTTLVRWGDVMSFCWLIWDDPRVAGADVLTYLTSIWLHHSGTISYSDNDLEQITELWGLTLTPSLRKCPVAALGALLRLFRHLIGRLCSSLSPLVINCTALDVLTKSCWAAMEILHLPEQPSLLPLVDLGVATLSIFVLIADDVQTLPMKAFMIETLNVLGIEVLVNALKGVQAATQFDFNIRLDSLLTQQRRWLLESNDFTDRDSDDIYLRINMTLNFLAVLFRSGGDLSRHQRAVSSLLCASTEHLVSRNVSSASNTVDYLSSLLVVLAILQDLGSELVTRDATKPWEGDGLRISILNAGTSNLTVASAAAHFLSRDIRRNGLDSLSSLEFWDYARDVLFFIIHRDHLGDDEPLALLVAPAIARLLVDLLHYADSDFARFMVASPWNHSVCARLREVLELNNRDVPYQAILRQRLKSLGPVLLDKVSSYLLQNSDTFKDSTKVNVAQGHPVSEPKTSAFEKPSPSTSMELIFYHTRNTLYPICVSYDLVDQD
ncbi:hypothetical protein NEOLEDRAFT_1237648 [Neolentinus lepideus HHB14362 ss-1]|uniref:Uncharacterized protein n=1 Tax=Neolentinus lepideus HHB14362 ss-1 TaxID=1314782 RepID=A0A165VY63_9AGAM|nr:hypothetical protein NEOLEDRAFT_1237648 [Neolentinus lepideus HHB14362 ss-1]